MIIKELRGFLEKDIRDRVVGPELKRVIAEEKSKGPSSAVVAEQKPVEKRGLKGLSFKKQKKRELVNEVKVADSVADEAEEEEEHEIEPPKKRRKKEVVKKAKRILEEDLESEDEDVGDQAQLAVLDSETKKRAGSEEREEEEEPVRKKQKVEVEDKGKKLKKKASKKTLVGEEDVVVPDADDFEAPSIAQVHLDVDSSLSPSRSPSPAPTPPVKRRSKAVTPPPTPPPDPLASDVCEDDEDLYFAKLALSGYKSPEEEKLEPELEQLLPPETPAFRKHLTGCARTEGYYKITHAEKAAYVAQYQARATNNEAAAPIDEPQPQHITSSRSNRANARRRAQGLEEINQVQRAVALSKGESAANELSFKFNQLQTRKKHLRFARSPIHDWGLYAMEKISRGEMVIEYVGEVIRAQVAEKREKAYERQGIGSSYLFRIDEDLVVDATKKGNLGRLINHSCDPNCTAKIITISGEKKIVIYAKQDIELGDEITYDYHFPFEQDKIPCLCGSAKCRGFLN
ncbi:hypothetical protein BDQ12DRAFT_693258 [Crucibulum laeve]|uniref:Histone-lysine N-methyltransferase, H3 lysine-4 specific n=1 Tax=Crucibulum laeve TaxID=68775 RepID=A0A5C3LGQ5_9AGAR|nr:hypothetical protein BDQ12DRAFT_693258 [Crucibulum laeve]